MAERSNAPDCRSGAPRFKSESGLLIRSNIVPYRLKFLLLIIFTVNYFIIYFSAVVREELMKVREELMKRSK